MNNDMAKSSPSAAGFFYRRIGGTLFKVRVYTGSGYADTPDEKNIPPDLQRNDDRGRKLWYDGFTTDDSSVSFAMAASFS
mgnify:FL=1